MINYQAYLVSSQPVRLQPVSPQQASQCPASVRYTTTQGVDNRGGQQGGQQGWTTMAKAFCSILTYHSEQNKALFANY